jgi:PHD/YefM family antitoxin component YafN of YafNO toxin-antitoxin module
MSSKHRPTSKPPAKERPLSRGRSVPTHDELPLSAVRARLSPLIKQGRPLGRPLGITGHSKVAAYLLTCEQLEQLLSRARQEGRTQATQKSLRGSIKLRRNPEEGSAKANRMLLESAAHTAEEAK